MEFKNGEEDSAKIKHLLEYFSGKLDRTEKEKKYYDRAKRLEKIMEIYESDELDVRKIAKMHELYRNSQDLICQFSDLEKYSDDKVVGYFVRKINAIKEYYQTCEEKGLVKEATSLIKLEEKGYFDDYVYACGFVEDFINYEDSPYINDFLESNGLNKTQFERFVEIVKTLNEELYAKYLEKVNSNIELRKQDVIRKINNLIEGAKTGKLSDNTAFDPVEYYANIPFYDDLTSKEVLKDFNIKVNAQLSTRYRDLLYFIDRENAETVLNYATINKLHFVHLQPMITENNIMSTNYIIDGYTLTDEDKNNIIEYMKKRKIPFLPKAYSEVRNKYLKQGLDNKKLNLRK